MTNLISNNNVAKAEKLCAQLLKLFRDKAVIQSLISLLIKYQPSQVTLYEVERCRYTLEHISVLGSYLELEIGKDVCVFLPSNLPLYSTLLFVVMPGIVSNSVTLRPNTALIEQGVIDKLFSILSLPKLLPNVAIFSGSREQFRELHLSNADLIIFTGRNETRDEIKKCMKPNSYLINNGSGHNPIVIGPDADIELSASEVLYARFFNSGQDCAGPDAVFVHDNVIAPFIKRIKEKISSSIYHEPGDNEERKQFSSQDQLAPQIEMAKLHRLDELLRLQSVIDSNKANTIAGGCVDTLNKIVHPTIIYDPFNSAVAKGSFNFSEMFGPIMFLYGYERDEDLKIYFENSRYTQNKMYVSLFGSSTYLQRKNDEALLQSKGSAKGGVGILLHNKIIHDINVDNGTIAYGGYSKGGSSILHKAMSGSKISSIALPILLPKVMHQLFVKELPLIALISRSSASDPSTDEVIKIHDEGGKNILSSSSHSRPLQNKILKQRIAIEILGILRTSFESNLNFGFAFGSVTEEKHSRLVESGVCTYVCTNQHNSQQYTRFTTRMEEFHRSYQYGFDHQYPVQLISCSELRQIIFHLQYQLYGCNYNPWGDEEEEPLNCSFLKDFKCHHEYTYWVIFMVSVLAEKPKFALIARDKKFFHETVDAAKEVTQLIRKEMLENIREIISLPEVLKCRYPGHSMKEILNNLENLSCCEILRLVEWMPPIA